MKLRKQGENEGYRVSSLGEGEGRGCRVTGEVQECRVKGEG